MGGRRGPVGARGRGRNRITAGTSARVASHLTRYRRQHLTVPTRLIVGDRDPIGSPAALLDGWQDCADDMRVDIVDGAGHLLPDEVPERVVAEVLEHFA